MTTIKFFKDIKLDAEFNKRGFVKYGQIDTSARQKLIDINNKLNIPDHFGLGYNVGMNSDIYELRKKMQDAIIELAGPFAIECLDNYYPYSATSHNKDTTVNLFVPAHQDFSYTREPEVHSVMCWIPLVDVTAENAALGFIPQSHLFYDYIRAFPFPLAKTPVSENQIRLMEYLEIIPMKAGEIIFFNHKIIHGSFANYSSKDRLAVGMNFVKNGEKILTYIFNPRTDGKTILIYDVDKEFIVKNNNLVLNKMYKEGTIQLTEKLIGEIGYTAPDTSWNTIEQKLNEYCISPRKQNIPLIDRFNKQKRKERFKDKVYNFISKFNPASH